MLPRRGLPARVDCTRLTGALGRIDQALDDTAHWRENRPRQGKAPPRRGNAAGPDPRVPGAGPSMRTRAEIFLRISPSGLSVCPEALYACPSAGSRTKTGITRSVFFW
ncbi:hypothetical protein ALMP_03310 [Streptomyces sp. A012304]|nr:hypothetical protein ALMP_03310 [Streptomyces sp. A012304]